MVEIEVTKEYTENKKARQLVNKIKKLKVGNYKTHCYQSGKGMKVVLESFSKRLTFNFIKKDKAYELVVRKVTQEGLLLSKALESLTGRKVKIKLGDDVAKGSNDDDDAGNYYTTEEEYDEIEDFANWRPTEAPQEFIGIVDEIISDSSDCLEVGYLCMDGVLENENSQTFKCPKGMFKIVFSGQLPMSCYKLAQLNLIAKQVRLRKCHNPDLWQIVSIKNKKTRRVDYKNG